MTQEATKPDQSPPFVSIITPFFNTDRYIAECIESVLAQTYSNWEYILVNNQSTDASRKIAERYAREDHRIRLIDTPKHLSQIENFNAAFSYMSPRSRYCKVVLADDWMFRDCLERMVALAEANPSVGIVSSYRLFGDEITGDGLPYSSKIISGRSACQHMIRDGYYLTGSPTSILLRADIVRSFQPFFPEEWIHDDTEACFRVLAEHDLGFIHQVLTYSRKDSESVSSETTRFGPGPIRKLMFALKYGPQFFPESEYRTHLRQATDFYGQFLAESVFQFKGKEFWEFQRRGLQVVDSDFWRIGLPKYVFLEFVDIILNPKKTAGRLISLLRTRGQNTTKPRTPLPSEQEVNR